MDYKTKAIITGSSGMVGEGVLHEALQHPTVESVLVINRKPYGVTHTKLPSILFTLVTFTRQGKGWQFTLA